MATQKKAMPMCVVNIGYHFDLLLPTADGMRLIEILQRSVVVDRDYGSGLSCAYIIKDQPNAEFSTVKPSQIRAARGTDGVLSLEDRKGGDR